MKLDRVIFACNLNANYIQFWPLVSRVWRWATGAKPTLFFIAPQDTVIEQVEGSEIYYIEPWEGIPTCYIAQTIRLVAPIWFPDEVCVISDIDLMMVHRSFFSRYLAPHSRDKLVVLNRYPPQIGRSSLCYHMAKGETFAEMFQLTPGPKTIDEVRTLLTGWYKKKQGQWATDELILHEVVSRFRRLHPKRVSVTFTPNLWGNAKWSVTHWSGFRVDPKQFGKYIEIEPPAPYEGKRSMIDSVVRRLIPNFPFPEILDIVQRGVSQKNRHPIKFKTATFSSLPLIRRNKIKLPTKRKILQRRLQKTHAQKRLLRLRSRLLHVVIKRALIRIRQKQLKRRI